MKLEACGCLAPPATPRVTKAQPQQFVV